MLKRRSSIASAQNRAQAPTLFNAYDEARAERVARSNSSTGGYADEFSSGILEQRPKKRTRIDRRRNPGAPRTIWGEDGTSHMAPLVLARENTPGWLIWPVPLGTDEL